MARIEQTQAVVEPDETYDGRILPTEQSELDRPVHVRSDATVQGSVYGGSIELDDGSAIEGSIMAADAIELDGGHVTGEAGTPGKVTATDSRVDGTVTGKRVRLVDCVVRGNVVGSDVILENCVVLGIATADRSLVLEDSLCYTFRSQGETRLADATVVLPQAIADGPLELDTPVAVAGLGRLDVDENSEELPTMDADDRYEQGDTRYLTLAPRILNLEKVTDRLDELEDAIMTAVDDTSGGDSTMDVDDVLETLDVEYEHEMA